MAPPIDLTLAEVRVGPTDLTLADVAHRSGFGSTQAMRRHFIAYAGASPRDYLAAFRAPQLA